MGLHSLLKYAQQRKRITAKPHYSTKTKWKSTLKMNETPALWPCRYFLPSLAIKPRPTILVEPDEKQTRQCLWFPRIRTAHNRTTRGALCRRPASSESRRLRSSQRTTNTCQPTWNICYGLSRDSSVEPSDDGWLRAAMIQDAGFSRFSVCKNRRWFSNTIKIVMTIVTFFSQWVLQYYCIQ